MPLEGLRWSRDSGSALYDTPQTAVLGRAGGAFWLRWFMSFLNLARFVIYWSRRFSFGMIPCRQRMK